MVGPGSGPGDNQPLKLAGYALLSVAAVAAIVGLITLAGGRSDAPPPPAASPAPSSIAAPPPSPVPPPPPLVGASPSNQPTTTAPALPGAGLPADGAVASGGKGGYSSVRAPVRVYNNSLVKGLADRAADDMRDSGWRVEEVANYSSGNIAASTVYYRPGTSEQAAARALASSFGLRVEPRFEGIKDASPGLIVILTKDYQRR